MKRQRAKERHRYGKKEVALTKHIKCSTQSESGRERAFMELSPTSPLRRDQILPKSSPIVPNRVAKRAFGRPWEDFWAYAAVRSPNLSKMNARRQEKDARGDPEIMKYARRTPKITSRNRHSEI